jgi:hypothetical protein
VKTIRVCILAFVAITSTTAAKPQQQKPAAQPTQAQLQQQIDELKKKLEDIQQTAATAKLTNDFAKQAQAEAKDYYDKVLATETRSLWIMGIFITVLLALAARIGFNTFDRLTQRAIPAQTTRLRAEYIHNLQKLKESNDKEMKSLSDALRTEIRKESTNLKTLSEWNFQTAQAYAFGAEGRHGDAADNFRQATTIYKEFKQSGTLEILESLTPQLAATIIENTLLGVKLQAPEEQQTRRIREELSNPLYDGLESELGLVAVNHPEYAQAIKDRKKPMPAPGQGAALAGIAGAPPPAE